MTNTTKEVTMEIDKTTEILARAWIACDPNRGGTDPDALIDHLGPTSTLNGKPKWHWFIPRADALKEFLAKNGIELREIGGADGKG